MAFKDNINLEAQAFLTATRCKHQVFLGRTRANAFFQRKKERKKNMKKKKYIKKKNNYSLFFFLFFFLLFFFSFLLPLEILLKDT